jgi:rhamnosyltransferase
MYFDQDSRVTKEYVKNMLAEYAKQEHPQKIGIIAPSYIDKHTGEALPNAPLPLGTGQLSSAWTSGSLMSTSLACKVGGFEEQLTIDLLDYEFSLRLRSKGYNILQCSSARLLHSPGHPKSFRFLGKDWFTTYNHQPARTYYLVRNRIWILRKYGGLSHRAMFPNLRRNDLVSLARHSLYLLIAEKSRWQKLCFIVKGAYDGIIDRMGKTVEL